jgi:hypothetical protein
LKIPLQPVDFEEGGFTSVAKFFSKRWPGGKLKLSEAQAILSRVMGYENYNDARHSAGNPSEGSVSAVDAKKAMLEALNKEVAVDGYSGEDLFDFLPFNYLRFFHENSPLESAGSNTRRL